MSIDQAEDLRRRLEARQTGKPYTPPDPAPESPTSFAPPAPRPLAPETQALAKQRKLEAALKNNAEAQPVVIVDVKMKFLSMVVFMVKWAFASIPALFIIAVITGVLFAVLGVFLKTPG